MIEAVTMYRVLCDGCGQPDDSDDYYAWLEDSQAIDMARESEWLITDDGGHFCAACQTWDEEKDEMVGVVKSDAG
jgi:hypothetical protein